MRPLRYLQCCARKSAILVVIGLVIYLIVSPQVAADTSPSSAQQEGITIDSVNLTAATFFAAYTGKTENDRHISMIYLLGVLDATERKDWCDYKTLQTITLREFVFEYFKKLPHKRLNERASKIINEALHKTFPCRGKR